MALINCWECGKKISDAALVCPGCGAPATKTPDISIHKAAEEGNIEAVKQHLAAGTDVNATYQKGVIPLQFASTKEIAELLIAKGADVNAKSDDVFTPLDEAVSKGKKETADFLRKHGGKTKKELEAEAKK